METLVKKGDVLHNISVFKNQIESTSGAITLLAKSDVIELLNKMQECMETMVEDVPQSLEPTPTKFTFKDEWRGVIRDAVREAISDMYFSEYDFENHDIASLYVNEHSTSCEVEISWNSGNMSDMIEDKFDLSRFMQTIETAIDEKIKEDAEAEEEQNESNESNEDNA
jgi:hypothetical protein